MRIVTTRRISQLFFFLLFLWFCIVSTPGNRFHQLDGWVVNWFLQLDPLVGIATILSTHTLYGWLGWGLFSIVVTILFGRFFCGWLCPFGTLHQAFSFVVHRKATVKKRLELNSYRPLQKSKYLLLFVFLTMAAYPGESGILVTGLLDPIPLFTRTVNLVLLPIVDADIGFTSVNQRWYQSSTLIGAVFLIFLLLNLVVPRFFCRFLCPTGALFGLFSRLSLFRFGKEQEQCSDCKKCEQFCEGGCSPSTSIKTGECLLCCNCIDPCKDAIFDYRPQPFPGNREKHVDLSRRGFTLSLLTGVISAPTLHLSNRSGSNFNPNLIRPPGSIDEASFLKRCIRCDQCIRVCPTNVLQAADLSFGLAELWTPRLNNRIGSSGCQLNCVACSLICPTAAIRPLGLAEKLGKNEFSQYGPIRIGTAFFDRGRCLPWAMDTPCIVCEENCPVSPKAIHLTEHFKEVRNGRRQVKSIDANRIELIGKALSPNQFGSGDYYCLIGDQRYPIFANDQAIIAIDGPLVNVTQVKQITIQVRLQQPAVDIKRCIGCGICEHECPVSGLKAVRVTSEGETRSGGKRLLLQT